MEFPGHPTKYSVIVKAKLLTRRWGGVSVRGGQAWQEGALGKATLDVH